MRGGKPLAATATPLCGPWFPHVSTPPPPSQQGRSLRAAQGLKGAAGPQIPSSGDTVTLHQPPGSSSLGSVGAGIEVREAVATCKQSGDKENAPRVSRTLLPWPLPEAYLTRQPGHADPDGQLQETWAVGLKSAPGGGWGPPLHSRTGFCCHRQVPGSLSSPRPVLASGQLQTRGGLCDGQ